MFFYILIGFPSSTPTPFYYYLFVTDKCIVNVTVCLPECAYITKQ